MRVHLTDRACAAAKPEDGKQIDLIDDKCRGLTLRVSKHGVKSWTLLAKQGGKLYRVTLGRYPDIPLVKARGLAIEARATLGSGAPKHGSLAEVFEEWVAKEASKLRSGAERQAVFKRLILPALGARPIREIRRGEIVTLLDRIEEENGPAMAQSVLRHLSSVLHWHEVRDENFTNPIIKGLLKDKSQSRDRILTDGELRSIWRATGDGQVFSRFVRFLLLTALRRNEAAAAHAREFENGFLVIPAERMKGKLEFVVPLGPQARELVGQEGWLFPMRKGPLVNFGRPKAELDAASGVTDWTLHDLRRTARSLMARAGVPDAHAEQCLAHRVGGVAGIYNRHAYLDEKRDALAKLATLVGEIVNG